MAKKVEHTATPWHVGPHYKSDVESRHGRVAECGILRGDQGRVDAKFIVKAVNCHDELLAALKGLMDGDVDAHDKVMAAHAAIAKAEA